MSNLSDNRIYQTQFNKSQKQALDKIFVFLRIPIFPLQNQNQKCLPIKKLQIVS